MTQIPYWTPLWCPGGPVTMVWWHGLEQNIITRISVYSLTISFSKKHAFFNNHTVYLSNPVTVNCGLVLLFYSSICMWHSEDLSIFGKLGRFLWDIIRISRHQVQVAHDWWWKHILNHCWVFPAGIAFLRGFQVSLQHLGGSRITCQLFLFHRNLTLQPSHAHTVRKSMLPFFPF